MSKNIFSMNGIARLFAVDRASVYSWIRRGCPCIDAIKPGLAAQLSFRDVLAWRKEYLAKRRWPDESITEMEARACQRLRAFKK